jgi:hypothetical protein
MTETEWVTLISGLVSVVAGLYTIMKFWEERLKPRVVPEAQTSAEPGSAENRKINWSIVVPALVTVVAVLILIAPWVFRPSPIATLTTPSVLVSPTAFPTILTNASTALSTSPIVSAGSLPPPTRRPYTPVPTRIACTPQAVFRSVLEARPVLGCPNYFESSYLGYQQFAGGWLVWRKSTNVTYSLFNNHKWDLVEPTPGGLEGAYCIEAQLFGDTAPILGFGQVWCEKWGDLLGTPLAKGDGVTNGELEQFENGLVLNLKFNRFVLYSNGSWEPY